MSQILEKEASDLPNVSGPVRVVHGQHARFVLLGTAHVSHASAEDVRLLCEGVAFDVIAPEICESRRQAMEKPDDWANLDLFSLIRQRKGGFLFASLLLSSYQRRIGEQWGIEPGAEMKTALGIARDQKREVACIDRELTVTLRRTGQALGWWQRLLMFSGMLASLFSREQITEEEVEKLKEGDVLESYFNEFAQQSPALYGALIDERDQTMAEKLRALDTPSATGERRQILAVLGAGHLKGVENYLTGDAADPQHLQAISSKPPPSRLRTALPWLIAALVLTGFTIGFSRSPELGWTMVADWILINGTLSAIGAAIALAHPLTLAAAFLAAPLTSLNPFLPAGVVAASLECWLRKPRVSDFQALRDDVVEVRGWWHNRAARILLVLVLTNLGSALATVLGGTLIGIRLFTN